MTESGVGAIATLDGKGSRAFFVAVVSGTYIVAAKGAAQVFARGHLFQRVWVSPLVVASISVHGRGYSLHASRARLQLLISGKPFDPKEDESDYS